MQLAHLHFPSGKWRHITSAAYCSLVRRRLGAILTTMLGGRGRGDGAEEEMGLPERDSLCRIRF